MATNEMSAKLISQAEQISELSATDLVSVSRGEGQPSLNIQFGDLVKAVATVIGTATIENEGLAPSWLVKGSTSNSGLAAIQIDFNAYEGDTMALCYGTNSPDGNTTRYFMLIQKEDVGRMKYQTAQNYEDGHIYRRTYSSKVGEWSPWVLDNFGCNTSAELASMVAEQIGIDNLEKAFNYKRIVLAPNSTVNLGPASGLLCLRNRSSNANPSLYLINNYHKKTIFVAGNDAPEFNIAFSGSEYNTEVHIENLSSIVGEFHISWQRL